MRNIKCITSWLLLWAAAMAVTISIFTHGDEKQFNFIDAMLFLILAHLQMLKERE